MAMTATLQTREDKLTWLLRPFEWASTVIFYSAAFGLAIYCSGKAHEFYLLESMIGSATVASALLVWGLKRVKEAAWGRV